MMGGSTKIQFIAKGKGITWAKKRFKNHFYHQDTKREYDFKAIYILSFLVSL
jgi:hypothetical protein